MNKLTERGFWTILGIMILATFIVEAFVRKIIGG